jgi:hypothetical protein
MMKVARTVERLFEMNDGGRAFDEADKLVRQCAKGSDEARDGLVRYMHEGRFHHVREHIASKLAEFDNAGDVVLGAAFRQGLLDEETRYWCIQGIVSSLGDDAYEEIAAMALDDAIDTMDRAQAIKCLAGHSRQPFDRGLDEDPGCWSPDELRTEEVKAWVDAGYPIGEGYAEPARHPALDKPNTKFEKTIAKLEKRLAQLRAEWQDLANPTNWLTPAESADIKTIKKQWKLPKNYLDFLTRFTPLKVSIPASDEDFAREIQLFGAADLIAGQAGYSIHGLSGKPIDDWPEEYLVIGQAEGDPYYLDLSETDGTDASVGTAEHGQGSWEFFEEADSFRDFLEELAIT